MLNFPLLHCLVNGSNVYNCLLSVVSFEQNSLPNVLAINTLLRLGESVTFEGLNKVKLL